jgi:hypothetical protein
MRPWAESLELKKKKKKEIKSQVWWCMPITPTLGVTRLRQEDHKTQASLGYRVRSCLKKNKRKNI